MKYEKFEEWLRAEVPLEYWDEGNAVLNDKGDISRFLRSAFETGMLIERSRNETELIRRKAEADGLRIALQDKVEIHHHTTNKESWWRIFKK